MTSGYGLGLPGELRQIVISSTVGQDAGKIKIGYIDNSNEANYNTDAVDSGLRLTGGLGDVLQHGD